MRADYAIEARGADEATAALLEVAVGEPVLVTMSTASARDGRVVEVGQMTYRATGTASAAPSSRRDRPPPVPA